eukprot:6209106-Pleurochrysis_carterae.AAC.1
MPHPQTSIRHGAGRAPLAAIPISLAEILGFQPMLVRSMFLHLHQNYPWRIPIHHNLMLRRRLVHPLLRRLAQLIVLLVHYRPGFALERRGRRPGIGLAQRGHHDRCGLRAAQAGKIHRTACRYLSARRGAHGLPT